MKCLLSGVLQLRHVASMNVVLSMMMRVTYTCCLILNGISGRGRPTRRLRSQKREKKRDIYNFIVVTSKLLYGSNMLLPTLLYRSILGSHCVPIFSRLQHRAS